MNELLYSKKCVQSHTHLVYIVCIFFYKLLDRVACKVPNLYSFLLMFFIQELETMFCLSIKAN